MQHKKILQIIKEEIARKSMQEAVTAVPVGVDSDQIVNVVTSSQKLLKAVEDFLSKATQEQKDALNGIETYAETINNMLQNPKSYITVVQPKVRKKIVLKPIEKNDGSKPTKTPVMSS